MKFCSTINYTLVLYICSIVVTAKSHLNESRPPIIDFNKLYQSNDPLDDSIVQITHALQKWGFFTVINHNISSILIESVLNQSQFFFQGNKETFKDILRTSTNSRGYSDKEFTKQKIDAKKVFDIGHVPFPHLKDSDPRNWVLDGYNQWPQGEAYKEFESVIKSYYTACEKLAYQFLDIIIHLVPCHGSIQYCAQHREEFQHYFLTHTSLLRLNYYPSITQKPVLSPKDDTTVVNNDTCTSTCTLNSTSIIPMPCMRNDETTTTITTVATATNTTPTNANSLNCEDEKISNMINITLFIQDNKKVTDFIHSVYGVSRHTDAGVFTILLQDGVSGLEVYTGSKEDNQDGTWVPVDPVKGGLTVNVGDMLQVWSNDYLKAAEHRVRVSTNTQGRYSIPFFYNPDYNAMIHPITTSSADSLPHYRPIRWGDFRMDRFLGDYSNRGREIQIEDYRIYT